VRRQFPSSHLLLAANKCLLDTAPFLAVPRLSARRMLILQLFADRVSPPLKRRSSFAQLRRGRAEPQTTRRYPPQQHNSNMTPEARRARRLAPAAASLLAIIIFAITADFLPQAGAQTTTSSVAEEALADCPTEAVACQEDSECFTCSSGLTRDPANEARFNSCLASLRTEDICLAYGRFFSIISNLSVAWYRVFLWGLPVCVETNFGVRPGSDSRCQFCATL